MLIILNGFVTHGSNNFIKIYIIDCNFYTVDFSFISNEKIITKNFTTLYFDDLNLFFYF